MVPAVTSPLDFTLSRIKPRWLLRRMELKLLILAAALAVVTYAPPSQAKPISLVERCYCRSTVNNLPRGYIRELRFIHTPNCPFQVIAKLKTNKEVCLNPEIRWLQQYLKNAINKMKKSKQGN
nr:stromal cell-derived factor 1 [Rachycentron canadum]